LGDMKDRDYISNCFYIIPTIQIYDANYPLRKKEIEVYFMWGFWELKIWG